MVYGVRRLIAVFFNIAAVDVKSCGDKMGRVKFLQADGIGIRTNITGIEIRDLLQLQ